MFAYIFNFYDIMLLTITTLSILLSAPLLFKRDKQQSDQLLAGFLLATGAIPFLTVLTYNKQLSETVLAAMHPFQSTFWIILLTTQGCTLYWYTQSMMGRTIKFLSPTMKILYGLMLVFILGDITYHLTKDSIKHLSIARWGMQLCSSYLGIKALIQLKNYDKKLRDNLSNLDKVNLNWLWYIASSFVFIWLISISSFVFMMIGYKDIAIQLGTFANVPPLFLLSFLVIYSQTALLNARDLLDNSPAEDKPKDTTLCPELAEKIDDLMRRVKIYQDPELKLEGLADCLNLSPRTISSILNGHYRKNFYDFINQYRVKDAKSQLRDPSMQTKSIQNVFEDAGFNSKTTFNTLFKKQTGQTPSEYRKHQASH